MRRSYNDPMSWSYLFAQTAAAPNNRQHGYLDNADLFSAARPRATVPAAMGAPPAVGAPPAPPPVGALPVVTGSAHLTARLLGIERRGLVVLKTCEDGEGGEGGEGGDGPEGSSGSESDGSDGGERPAKRPRHSGGAAGGGGAAAAAAV